MVTPLLKPSMAKQWKRFNWYSNCLSDFYISNIDFNISNVDDTTPNESTDDRNNWIFK